MLSWYFYNNRSVSSSTTNTVNSGYQPFLGSSTTPATTSNDTAGNANNNAPDAQTTNEEAVQGGEPSKFHQITTFAVAGAVFFEDTRPIQSTEVALTGGEQPLTTTDTAITVPLPNTKTKPKGVKKPPAPKFEIVPSLRYVDRITGHISQMYLDTKAVGENSNSTIPGIYEALFDGQASSVIYRYVAEDGKTVTSFLATLGGTAGEFLPPNILDVSISPDKTKFFYLTKNSGGVSGTIRSFKDTKKTLVFNSSLTELLSQWVADQKIYLTTKAASSVEGDLFSLNTSTGVLSKVFGGVRGLTTLANKDGSLVLYNASTSSSSQLGIFNVKTHTTKNLNLEGLPEKCVWADTLIYCAIPNNMTAGQYPDIWYKGLTSFSDSFMLIDTLTGSATTIANSTSETPIDGTHLFISKAGDQLFFINKKDSTLWSLDLK